jgi:hypothetical protein
MDKQLEEFFTSRKFYKELAKGGKKFYDRFTHYVRDNLDKVDDIKKYLIPTVERFTLDLEFWVNQVILNNNLSNRVNYIYTVLEFRRYYIMYDAVFGNKFEKYQKFTLRDSIIAKLLAEGKLEELIQGKSISVIEQTSNVPPGPPPSNPPNNTNRPPLEMRISRYIDGLCLNLSLVVLGINLYFNGYMTQRLRQAQHFVMGRY